MSDTSHILLSDAEASLRKIVRSILGSNSLEEVFVGWALHGTPEALPLADVFQISASKKGALPEHTDVAMLGFGLACGLLDTTQRGSFLSSASPDCADETRSCTVLRLRAALTPRLYSALQSERLKPVKQRESSWRPGSGSSLTVLVRAICL